MDIVIVGGGFGGVRAALNLANDPAFSVKLITDKTYFEYHAALYRSATGRSPLEVAIPLTEFFGFAKNVEVVEDKIVAIDPDERILTGASESIYRYNALILAIGSVTHYFGIKGLQEYSFGVKTIHEALELKRHIHEDLIKSEHERNYVVIGAGATGLELAAELTAYLKRVRRNHKVKRSFNVDLIEAESRVLPTLAETFSRRIERRLRELNVRLYFNTPVKAETVDSIRLPQGEIKSQTVIWTAGVANNPFFSRNPAIFKLQKNGKVVVNEYLEAVSDVYVIGDSAATQYSGMAQTALHDANYVTANLRRVTNGKKRRPYQPKRPIYAIPVGPNWSAVLWGKVQIFGYFGWFLRRLADLRLYLRFLSLRKALTTWRYGFISEEVCQRCK